MFGATGAYRTKTQLTSEIGINWYASKQRHTWRLSHQKNVYTNLSHKTTTLERPSLIVIHYQIIIKNRKHSYNILSNKKRQPIILKKTNSSLWHFIKYCVCIIFLHYIINQLFAQIQQITNLITLTLIKLSLKLININKKSESESREQEREWEQDRVWVWVGRKGKSNSNNNSRSGSGRVRKMRFFSLWSRGGEIERRRKWFSSLTIWTGCLFFYFIHSFFFLIWNPNRCIQKSWIQWLEGAFYTIQGILCPAS